MVLTMHHQLFAMVDTVVTFNGVPIPPSVRLICLGRHVLWHPVLWLAQVWPMHIRVYSLGFCANLLTEQDRTRFIPVPIDHVCTSSRYSAKRVVATPQLMCPDRHQHILHTAEFVQARLRSIML